MSGRAFTVRAFAARALFAALVVASGSCKVGFTDINAGFTLADASWFEAEETLFYFWRVNADQAIGPESEIEVAWTTDDVVVPFTPIHELPWVHEHAAVDCGVQARCGSVSFKVSKPPRQVQLQLRYHRDGQLVLPARVTFNAVGAGPAHTQRSLAVYGVFDETNTQLQWRARHQFPAIRNMEASELGLRRYFRVEEMAAGNFAWNVANNRYGYAYAPSCPGGLITLGFERVDTKERAIFHPTPMPVLVGETAAVCGRSTVLDAKGEFTAVATARKNPQTRPAFPELRSPVKATQPVSFIFKLCNKTISDAHFKMQLQRMQMAGVGTTCIDDWNTPGWVDRTAATLRAQIDVSRVNGKDMALLIVLHHDVDNGTLGAQVEKVLEVVVPVERTKSSPRLVGAFVFDSYAYQMKNKAVKPLVLWCPAFIPTMPMNPEEAIPDAAQRSCPLLPDILNLTFGALRLSDIPILPTRAKYESFIKKYSEANAGRTTKLTVLAPERTPISRDVQLGEFGVATFFNNETFPAQPSDAFSYCAPKENPPPVVFAVPGFPTPAPLSSIGQIHSQFPQPNYELGLAWDFPFLTRLEYTMTVAGGLTAFGLTVPFGFSGQNTSYYGTPIWETGTFDLREVLLQCTRWCDHPTFDSAGVYNADAPFRTAYAEVCYRPKYPTRPGEGFPLDP